MTSGNFGRGTRPVAAIAGGLAWIAWAGTLRAYEQKQIVIPHIVAGVLPIVMFIGNIESTIGICMAIVGGMFLLSALIHQLDRPKKGQPALVRRALTGVACFAMIAMPIPLGSEEILDEWSIKFYRTSFALDRSEWMYSLYCLLVVAVALAFVVWQRKRLLGWGAGRA